MPPARPKRPIRKKTAKKKVVKKRAKRKVARRPAKQTQPLVQQPKPESTIIDVDTHLPIRKADANIAQIVDEELRRMRGGGKKHRPD